MRTTIKVEGLREFDRSLAELSKGTARAVLRRTLMKAGAPMAETMRRLAPDDPQTGAPDLRTSIAVSPTLRNPTGATAYAAVMQAGGGKAAAVKAMRDARRDGGSSFAEVHVGPGKGGSHGVLQEFGTRHHPAKPFVRPAWDQDKGQALDIIKGELGGEIDKAAARARRRAARLAARG